MFSQGIDAHWWLKYLSDLLYVSFQVSQYALVNIFSERHMMVWLFHFILQHVTMF